ncbi:N-acyl-D-amino-acid deacylase [Kribbella orskensis]|uniref:N-acyl-D-amino-acid deacylase n=1 Tax=Kribbella orskensis TaxID=2512216 RepID=A0ABY2BHM8_9ACTN|nr:MULTISPECIES: D-aminoacylase [Kribbella]TCN38622.1 N-acyl-D-amino-acid deacylase [Kribbella sp. VKM Ac-2500]TCO20803.1 N-acyl-D-amino-acid deacylase [Kribbella orskensis]
MTELLITGATVVDGTGAPGVRADVAVDAGRIVAIGNDLPAASWTIPADGLVLSPGFIDMHAHSDLQILANPDHLAKVSQGVTLEVLGQDGLSFAPIDDATRSAVRRQIAGWNGEPDDFDFSWSSVAGYLDRLDRGIACNAAYLVPQGTLRMMVVGTANRPATSTELAEMKRLLAEGLEQGAVGMSSGLTYTPGMFADTAELIELCRLVAEYGGYYSPHQRSYGKGALEAYGEMVDVARESGCALHLTHATMNFEPNKGRGVDLLAMIDEALAGGIDITTDTYPYLPGATTLSAILPSWTAEGGPDALLARLADPADRERIAYELEQVGTDGSHGCVTDWNTIEISGVRNQTLSGAVGNTVAAIAAGIGKPPSWVFFDLLVRDNLATTILQHIGHEENVRAIMKHPAHTGGSDAILVGGKPHPRAWGTFPRYLARYVRELGVLELEDCVHHLTGRPAGRLRLNDRGLVREGYHADLVLFDPATVRDTATFDNPRQQAEGIPWVLVGGVPVIADGRRTDALPGRAIRRTATNRGESA